LNSVVCIAQVPDTESRIKIAGDAKKIDEAGLKFIVSPYDEYALEEAIRLKEKSGGDVTVIAFGPDRAQQALRESLARGATKGLHVKGETSTPTRSASPRSSLPPSSPYRMTWSFSASRASAPTTRWWDRWSRSCSAIRRSTS